MSHALLQTPTRRRAEAFARLLEGGRAEPELASLGMLATALRDLPLPRIAAPDPDFRARLRQRVVAAAAGQASRSGEVSPGDSEPGADPGPRLRIRARTIGLATAAGLALGTGGVGVASASALPGDTLYGVKRATESLRLAVAGSDLDRGRLALDFSAVRLSEVEQLVERAGGDAGSAAALSPEVRTLVRSALEDFDESTREGARTLLDVHESSGASAPLTELDDFARQQRPRLAVLLTTLPSDLRTDAARSLALVERLLGRAQRLLDEDAAQPAADGRLCGPERCRLPAGPADGRHPTGVAPSSPADAGVAGGGVTDQDASSPPLPGVDLGTPDETETDEGVGGIVDDLLGGSQETQGPSLPASTPTLPPVGDGGPPPDPTDPVDDATSAANDTVKGTGDTVDDLSGGSSSP